MFGTTLQGVLTILAGVVAFVLHGVSTHTWFDPLTLATLSAAVTAGVGLIKAADAPK